MRRYGARHRLARIAAVFAFVAHAVDAPEDGADGTALLLALAGRDHGPAVILTAMLLALGERARVLAASGVSLVRVRIGLRELAALPPHATVVHGAGCYLVLDPRSARRPLGFVPRPLRREMVDTLTAAN
ncbi:MAG TPA: hypothetical protein VGQ78_01320 [Vicinamibacteria bacterium]|nr:hypothetical protein [Vicinamibacteria bacterium]